MGNLRRFWAGEEGQGLVEYALIITLVALVVIVSLSLIGTNLGPIFTSIAGAI